MLEDLYNLSFYKEITVLNKAHKISLVQHIESGKTYVKKEMSLYNKDVFEKIKNNPVIGVPKIFEVCENDGILTIIEEYISGCTFDELLKKNGIFTEDDVRLYVSQLCTILDALHSFTPAIIHRDIKPSNVILTDDNRIVLIDLNSAKTETKGQSRDTELIGTQGFAAPEQYGFGASNIQTDIYNVGKLMTVMLTGDTDGLDVYTGNLKDVIEHCICIDPKDRYETTLQLKKALKQNKVIGLPFRKPNSVCIVAIVAITLITLVLMIVRAYMHKIDSNSIVGNTTTIDNYTHPSDSRATQTFANHLSSSNDGDYFSGVSSQDYEQVLIEHEEKIKPVDQLITSPIGAYIGNDDEVLVIAENGLAYYYCSIDYFTELECPWKMTDDTITISLSKLHCDVTASTTDGCATLIFRSNSSNWNTEEFIWFTKDYESYIKEIPPSSSKNVNVLNNGDMQVVINNIQITIPKNFLDYSKEINLNELNLEIFSFIDNDVSSGYLSTILLYAEAGGSKDKLKENYKSLAKDFADKFMDNVQIGHSTPITVAGYEGYSVTVSGLLNYGFSKLSSSIFSGPIIIVYDDINHEYIYLFFSQVVGADRDDTEIFNQIVNSAHPF